MPVLRTGVVENIAISGTRPIYQIQVLMTNNNGVSGTGFIEGSYLSGSKTPFALSGIDFLPGAVSSKVYLVDYDFFQVDLYVSLPGITMNVFAVSPVGDYSEIPVTETPTRRITAAFRDDLAVTSTEFAAISFIRRLSFSQPYQYAAALLPQSLDLLGTKPFRYKVVLGGTTDGAYVPYPIPGTNISAVDTALLVNYTCTTLTGGQVIFEGQGTGLSGTYVNMSMNLLNNQLYTALPKGTSVTLVIVSLLGSDSMAATFRMEEQW